MVLAALFRRLRVHERRGTWLWLAVTLPVVLSAVLNAWLWSRHLYSLSNDESTRVTRAWAWAFDAESSVRGSWLPGFTWLHGIGLRLFPVVFWTPRVVTCVFGALSLPILSWLAWELFHRRSVAVLTAWIALLLPERILLSGTPLAEAPHWTFLLLGTTSLLRYANTRKPVYVAAAACCLAVATTFRYEAWIWGLFVGCWLVAAALGRVEFESRRTAVLSAVILLAFPLGYMFARYAHEGAVVATSTSAYYEARFGTSMIARVKNGALTQFFAQNWRTGNWVGLTSLVVCFAQRRWRPFILLWAVTLLTFGIAALFTASVLPSHRFWRIPVPWTLMLCPFTAHALTVGVRHLIGRSSVRVLLRVAFAGVIFTASPTFVRAQGSGSFARSTLRMSQEVARHYEDGRLPTNGKVLVLANGGHAGHLRAGAGQPTRYVMARKRTKRYVRGTRLDSQRLQEEGIAGLVADKEHSAKLRKSPQLERVARHGEWTFYRVRPAQRMSGLPIFDGPPPTVFATATGNL